MNKKLARRLLFGIGLVCGSLSAFGFVAAVLIVYAQNSLAGQNLRHIDAAERRER